MDQKSIDWRLYNVTSTKFQYSLYPYIDIVMRNKSIFRYLLNKNWRYKYGQQCVVQFFYYPSA
jgi:hypothetical protein